MKNSLFRTLALCAVYAATSPLTARAAPGVSDTPVRLDRCGITSRSILLDPFNGLRSEYVTGLGVRFTNLRRATISAVHFVVRYQGETVSLVDRGTFAGGSLIDRTYSTFAGQLSGSDSAACVVTAVEFDDGTTWPGN